MAQFSVNAQRFDPYKNFKFRIKWDGRYVAGVSKVSALKRSTEVVEHREGGDPSTGRKSPGRTKFEAITLERGVTHDTEFEKWANKVWNFGSGPRCRGLAEGLSQGPDPRGLQRDRSGRARLQGLPLLGLRVPGAARPRRQCQRDRDPAPQARERRLGARLRRDRAERTELHRAGMTSVVRALSEAALLDLWEAGEPCRWLDRALLMLWATGAAEAGDSLADWPLGARDAALLHARRHLFGAQLPATADCPACAERMSFDLDLDALAGHASPPARDAQVALPRRPFSIAHKPRSGARGRRCAASTRACRALPHRWRRHAVRRCRTRLSSTLPSPPPTRPRRSTSRCNARPAATPSSALFGRGRLHVVRCGAHGTADARRCAPARRYVRLVPRPRCWRCPPRGGNTICSGSWRERFQCTA